MQLRDHAFRQVLDLAIVANGGFGEKTFSLCPIKPWMHAGNVVERLRDANPAWEHGNIGDEADVTHQLVAFGPRVASQYTQFSLVGREAKNCVESSGFARAIRANDAENAAVFYLQIDAVKRDGFSKRFTETASFYAGHSFSAPLQRVSTQKFSTRKFLSQRVLNRQALGRKDSDRGIGTPWNPMMELSRSGRPARCGRAAEWLRGCGASLRQEISGAHLAAIDRAHRH